MGRSKRSATLKILEGTADKRTMSPGPQPSGVPEPASWFTKEHQWIWNRVVPELIELGIATKLDEPVLHIMCDLWADYSKLRRKRNLAAADYSRLQSTLRQFHQFASNFGLTPAAREKLAPRDRPRATDKVAKYLS